MKRYLIALAAAVVATPVFATERTFANRIGENVYKLDNGRTAITSGCSVPTAREEAILNDREDILIFLQSEEQCDIKEMR